MLLNRNKQVEGDECAYLIFWPNSLFDYIHYFGRAYILQDVTLYVALSKHYGRIRLVRYQNCLDLNSSEIVYYSAVPFGKGGVNQGEHLYDKISKISASCYPSAQEIRFWENKDYMHGMFDKIDVPCPKTYVLDSEISLENIVIDFPVLTKIPNGNHSRGIVSHDNVESLSKFLMSNDNKGKVFLLQQQLDIKFDIRVVTIGDKVVYHYWRDKQESNVFTTTSTSNGSTLRVDALPQELVDCVTRVSKDLGLLMAAYDITYSENNKHISPVIFEVSPSFLLNPIPKDINTLNSPYVEYKNSTRRFIQDRLEQFVLLKIDYVKEVRAGRVNRMG